MEEILQRRKAFDQRHFPYDYEPTVSATQVMIAGVSCYWFTPAAPAPGRIIVYLHGGGFAMGSARSHGQMSNMPVSVPHTAVLISPWIYFTCHPTGG